MDRLKNVQIVSIFDSNRIAGHYNDFIIDTLTDNITPESDLIDKQFIDITHNYFSPLELDCLLGFRTRKDSAEMTGKNYKYFCTRLNEKLVKFKTNLMKEGYEEKDFINLEKKRRLLVY